MADENLLIKRILQGDQKSFEEIIDKYKNYIFAIILNFIKDYEEAENVAQEVFLQIYLSLPRYKEDNFKAWIARITSNKAIDSIRRKKSKFQEELLGHDNLIEKIFEIKESDQPLSQIIRREDKEELEKVLDSLPDIYREVLVKYYYEEKSYLEISKEDDLPIKTIESRLYRGRNILREKWRERHETL